MPLYEYQCDACGRRFEKIQKFSDAPLETCALCGKGPVHKLLSSPAIQFKGSGWYITDYAKKGSTSAGESSGSSSSSASSESSEKKSDSTSASTSADPKSSSS
jgi:putative FmdB family regulatory protein